VSAIIKGHRFYAHECRADKDASELFAFAMWTEDEARHSIKLWGAKHQRYAKIRRSYAALVRELSLKLDAENDLGLRPGPAAPIGGVR